MANSQIIELLGDLAQMDINAIYAYHRAIDGMNIPPIRLKLVSFRSEHEKHLQDISQLIVSYGGNPPERSHDFKGFLIDGMTSLAGNLGAKRILMAMLKSEGLTKSRYKKAMSQDLPDDVRHIIKSHYKDEKRHHEYLEEALKTLSTDDESLNRGLRDRFDQAAPEYLTPPG